MVEIYLNRDEFLKSESELWIEIRKKKQREYSKQYRITNPEYSNKRYLRQNSDKLGSMIPLSNYEWKKKSVIYPTPPDKRGLIDLSQYKKCNR